MKTVSIAQLPKLPAELAVQNRYAEAAGAVQEALCCPVNYDAKYLKLIPQEVIEKDYGCGDPSRWLREGETVLDLGSGAGKICFIAAQVVGPKGRVIGVDMTDEMLAVARRNAPVLAERLGFANVEFRRGRIQDLALDLDLLDRELAARPILDAAAFLAGSRMAEDLRRNSPLVPDGSVDVVVSNCVLNLVEPQSKERLFAELFRVLRVGGRVVISDIVSAEPVPQILANDPALFSGCISGAFTEEDFLARFEEAGFYGVEIVSRETKAWRVVEGIEFRSVTVRAFKGEPESESEDLDHDAIYLGPFKQVLGEFGQPYSRGERTPVTKQTANLLRKEPYAKFFAVLDPTPGTADAGEAGCCGAGETGGSDRPSCC